VREVSAVGDGWAAQSEKALFIWFAARPLAQAKAAVITSLLPWPDNRAEQERLKDLVRRAMTDRDAAHDELVRELAAAYPDGASMLDPFSGRAMIPLEAARLGVRAWGIDYSPVGDAGGHAPSPTTRSATGRGSRRSVRGAAWVRRERAVAAPRSAGRPRGGQDSRATSPGCSARWAAATRRPWRSFTRAWTVGGPGATCGR